MLQASAHGLMSWGVGAATSYQELWSEVPGASPLPAVPYEKVELDEAQKKKRKIFQHWGWRQDGGVEGLKLISFHENSKTTTNCWTTTEKIDLKLPKKISYTQMQKWKHKETVGHKLLWHKQTLLLLGGWLTNWKHKIDLTLPKKIHQLETTKKDTPTGNYQKRYTNWKHQIDLKLPKKTTQTGNTK